MADFCTKCVIHWCLDELSEDKINEALASGPNEWGYSYPVTVEDMYNTINPDIDVFKIAAGLAPGYVSYGHICEGCGLTAIRKNEDKIEFAYLNFSAKPGDVTQWHEFPDYRKLNCSLVDLVKAYKKKENGSAKD